MRILMTTSTFPRWNNDSEMSVVFDIAKNIKSYHRETSITILAPHFPGAKTDETISNIKIKRFIYMTFFLEKLCYDGGVMANIKHHKLLILLIPFLLLFQLLAIIKIIKKENIQIIHAHWLLPQGLTAVIYKKLFNKNIKIILTAHGSDINQLQGIINKKIKNWIIDNVDSITTVSQDLKNKINIINNKKKILVIPNGIDLKLFQSNPLSLKIIKKFQIKSYCLLYIGRLSKEKGIYTMINAIQNIVKQYPLIKLLIIGFGPEYDTLQSKIEKRNLEKNIILVGKIPHNKIIKFYNTADILLTPSLNEGFGITCLEAMACHTPVIASNVGGIPEILKHNYNGLLFPVNNSATLANCINSLLTDKRKIKKLTDNAYNSINKKFNWKKISNQYYSSYAQL